MKTPRWVLPITRESRAHVGRILAEAVQLAPVGTVLAIFEARKTRDQESKYHPMLRDIAAHCTFAGAKWSEDDWKRLMVDGFVSVEREAAADRGEPDPFPAQAFLMPSMDGRRVVQLGAQTREFTRAQSSDFIEHLYAFGSEQGVTWSEKAQRVIRHFTRARRAVK